MRAALLALGLVIVSLIGPLDAPARAGVELDSAYLFESAYLNNMREGDTGTFVVFFQNTGAAHWILGGDSQINLATCREDKVTCNVSPRNFNWNPGTWLSTTAYAAQAKSDVAPGDFTSFSYQIKVPVNIVPATYRFNGDLVIAATGVMVHPEGYFQDATVISLAAQAPSDLAAIVTDTNGVGGPNDVRTTFTAPVRNTANQYEVQRRNSACPADPADQAFFNLGTVTVSPGQSGSFVDVDRPNGDYCYQVRVKDPATGVFAYSNQVTASVTRSTTGVAFTSTSAVLTRANQTAPGRLFTGDSFDIVFTLPVKLSSSASMRFADSDCGQPPSQAGPPATCPSGVSQTTGDVTCAVNANCVLSLDSKTLTVTLTAAPNEVAPGSTTGLQYSVTAISSSGITDAGGDPWDLANSADRVIGPLGQ
jgi:hypothetical protein